LYISKEKRLNIENQNDLSRAVVF